MYKNNKDKEEIKQENIVVGRNPVMELLKTDKEIEKIYVQTGEREGSITKIVAVARNKGIIVDEVDKKRLDSISAGVPHQGVAAVTTPIEYVSVDEMIQDARDKNQRVLLLICDDIEDPHNLGAIIRCADGAGCNGVILSKRHSSPITQTVIKSSAGAISYVKLARVSNIAQTIESLKKKNIWVYAADERGELYTSLNYDFDCAIVMGNEGHGVSQLVKDKCDGIISIPMRGGVSSLNVSTASAVILYEISNKQNR